jgi:DNA-directed RNA polymerase subunit alpha
MKKLKQMLVDDILFAGDEHHNSVDVHYRQAIILNNRLYSVTGFGEDKMTLQQVGELLGVSGAMARYLEQRLIRKILRGFESMKRRADQKYVVVKETNLPSVINQQSLVTALPISALNLSVRTGRVLANMGIHSVEQLANVSRQYIMVQPNFGKVSLQELERKMQRLGISFADNQTFHAKTGV